MGKIIFDEYTISRYGINKIQIINKDKEKIYWGIMTQQALIYLMLKGGLMYESTNTQKIPIRINLAGGIAIW